MNKFYNAIATLVGTIIGAGIFGLPYVASKAGLTITVFYMVALSVIVTLLHLLYGEVALRTNGNHRLVGYASIYLGKWGKRISSFSVIFGSYAALLAYVILGGIFMNRIFGGIFGGTDFIYSLAFFFISSILIAKGLRMVSRVELLLSFFLVAAIFVFLIKGLFFINFSNFYFPSDLSDMFLPYGVILFSLSGASVIPELIVILKENKAGLKKAIIWGTMIPAAIYFFFVIVVLGVSGIQTSQDSISGLAKYYGDGIITFGAFIGFLAVITSFLAFGVNLKKTFEYDYNVSQINSLILALFIPFALFVLGIDNFIKVISFAGAIGGGLDGIIIILMYRKADRERKGNRTPEYDITTGNFLECLIIAIFALGVAFEIAKYVN